MFGDLGLIASAGFVTVVLAVLLVRYGWRVLFVVVPAVAAGGLAFVLGLPVPVALAAAAAVAVLPLFLVIRAAWGRGPGAQRPAGAVPVAAQVALQAHAPPAVAPLVLRRAARVDAPAAVDAPAWQPNAAGPVAAGPAIVRVRTGKGWVRAAGFGLFGLVFPAILVGIILSNPSADAEGRQFVFGLGAAMLVLFEGLALVFVQHARSGAVVDRAAGTVTVRRGRGLSMKRTVLPLSGVAAVEVASHQRRVITPKHGLGAVIELVRYIAAPKRETVYEAFLSPSAGGPRVLVSPFAEKQASAVLPLAEQLAKAIGCPLQAPSSPGLVPSGPTAASPAAAGPVTV